MANVDWGDEVKPRPHSGRLGMDRILKDDARRDLQAVQGHLTRDPSLLLAKSGGHNRTFLWEATRGNHPDLVKHLLRMGADPNIPGRIRSECVVLLKPYCLARRYRHPSSLCYCSTRGRWRTSTQPVFSVTRIGYASCWQTTPPCWAR